MHRMIEEMATSTQPPPSAPPPPARKCERCGGNLIRVGQTSTCKFCSRVLTHKTRKSRAHPKNTKPPEESQPPPAKGGS
jgi:hypothetical protein